MATTGNTNSKSADANPSRKRVEPEETPSATPKRAKTDSNFIQCEGCILAETLAKKSTKNGMLSYIFNSFVDTRSFSEVVMMAKAAGHTEPDPRDDLAGTDVARKVIILARE